MDNLLFGKAMLFWLAFPSGFFVFALFGVLVDQSFNKFVRTLRKIFHF